MNSMEAVFAVPELITLVASFLERQDLSRFMSTNRAMHSLCTSWFYQQVDIRSSPDYARRLVVSREGLEALARNVDFVKGIRMDAKFFDHYYNCLNFASLEQQAIGDVVALERVRERAGARRETGVGIGVGGLAEGSVLEGVVFPRMTNLSRFEFNPPAPGEEWNHLDLVREDQSKYVLPRFCFMVPPEQSHRLEILTLNGMRVRNARQLTNLARIVAGMTSLHTLRLGIEYPTMIRDNLITEIFFSLPSSMQVFTVHMADMGFEGNESIEKAKIFQRDEPLINLKEWDVGFDHLLEDPEPLFQMFPHCPGLEIVMVPQMMKPSDEDLLATFILNQCPKITQLRCIDFGFDYNIDDDAPSDYGNYDGLLQKISSAMVPCTLQSFYYFSFYENREFINSRLPRLLETQFDSLTRIKLEDTHSLCRFSVSQLLHLTPLLESLVICGRNSKWEDAYGLELQCLSDVSWATNRLQELRLVVDIGYLQVLRMDPLNHSVSIPRIQIDVMTMSFGSLLANIGKQKDLRVLDLKIAIPNLRVFFPAVENHQTYRNELFPGLLSLGGRSETGAPYGGLRRRRGLLDMLAGLSKLEELRGSVNVNPRDQYGYTTGWREAMWMREHWPRLKIAELYPHIPGYITPPIAAQWVWLQKQLPGLIYTDDHSA
ncbi:hypothetical protein EC991_001724 [Linnemannia zychae]|nr:hypothetical protein EC991_001724 [Linnemannia zychae]